MMNPQSEDNKQQDKRQDKQRDRRQDRRQDQRPLVTMVVATDEKNAIGKANQLLWHLPNDLKFFKQITTGHTVIMGRKTFSSIGKALPNRRNIVITRQTAFSADSVEVVRSIQEAIDRCQGEQEVFIIGGGEIYQQSLAQTDRIYLTRVHSIFEADTYFPALEDADWKFTELESFPADERHPYTYSFIRLDRKTSFT